jgi:NAD(P)-dependent dehydrogenase (short-subunit alcohol dehydrogenase family)
MTQVSGGAESGYRLDDRVAVVTGAVGGLGKAIVDRLVELGARVALLDLPAALTASSNGGVLPARCVAIGCDIGDESSVAAAAAKVTNEMGPCDILVNNAGILAPHCALQDLTLAVWERSMTVNLRGPFLCSREFGKQMLARGRGSIVNIASIAGWKPNSSPSYSVSKAGVLALTRHTAVEWGPRGVRSNSVSPGFIQTALSAAHYTSTEQTQARIAVVPLRRLGIAADVANAVAYLASDAAAFVNGQDLIVDGGFLETPLMHAQPKADQYGGYGA